MRTHEETRIEPEGKGKRTIVGKFKREPGTEIGRCPARLPEPEQAGGTEPQGQQHAQEACSERAPREGSEMHAHGYVKHRVQDYERRKYEPSQGVQEKGIEDFALGMFLLIGREEKKHGKQQSQRRQHACMPAMEEGACRQPEHKRRAYHAGTYTQELVAIDKFHEQVGQQSREA